MKGEAEEDYGFSRAQLGAESQPIGVKTRDKRRETVRWLSRARIVTRDQFAGAWAGW